MAAARDSRGFAPAMAREANVGEAALRVYETGQALTLQRLEFWMAEARMHARSGAGALFAACVAFAGWFYFVAGVINALAREYPRFAVEMSVGGFHVVLALALFTISQRALAEHGGRS